MSRDEGTVHDSEPAAESADTVPAPGNGSAILVDEDCFLCVSLPATAPDGSGLENPDFHYAHGFADGVAAMIRGQGWHYCERHRHVLRRALLDRGVNWSPEPDLRKRSRVQT